MLNIFFDFATNTNQEEQGRQLKTFRKVFTELYQTELKGQFKYS